LENDLWLLLTGLAQGIQAGIFLNPSLCLTIPWAGLHLLYFYFSFIEQHLIHLHKIQNRPGFCNLGIADKECSF
jgi:hypothetical protein